MPNTNEQQHRPLEFSGDRDAFLERAFEADDGCISVGGLAHQLGMLQPEQAEAQASSEPTVDAYKFEHTASKRRVLSEFVELSRRQRKLKVVDFAKKAGISVEETLALENPSAPSPEPRVLFKVATFLKADIRKLQVLAGHTDKVDDTTEEEVLKIAASVAGNEPLSRDEQQMLREMAKFLMESS